MASASLLAANKVAQPVFHCTTAAAVWEVDPDTWRMIIDTNVNGSQPLESRATRGGGRPGGDG